MGRIVQVYIDFIEGQFVDSCKMKLSTTEFERKMTQMAVLLGMCVVGGGGSGKYVKKRMLCFMEAKSCVTQFK